MNFDNLNSAIQLISDLSVRDLSKNEYESITNAFRYLRNSSAKGYDVQNEIIKDAGILFNSIVLVISKDVSF